MSKLFSKVDKMTIQALAILMLIALAITPILLVLVMAIQWVCETISYYSKAAIAERRAMSDKLEAEKAMWEQRRVIDLYRK